MEPKLKENKVVATIEARMSSTRLPGKVLMDLGGYKSLELQIKRLRKSKLIDEVVIATTVNELDDAIVDFGKSMKCKVFRGSEDDVMKRILDAVKSVGGEIQVQITGDCPLIDARVIDKLIRFLLCNLEYDFVSNEIERTYPIGLDCRVFKVSALEKANSLCDDPIHRLHGSTFIYTGEHKSLFLSKKINAPKSIFYPNWRWTLDTKEDLEFLRSILDYYGKGIVSLSSSSLAKWLIQNPKIIQINSNVRQKNLEEG